MIKAFRNSCAGMAHLIRHEAAFRSEMILFVVAIPAAWYLADSLATFIWLLGSLLVIMIVELLNTGIEQVCNALTREYRDEIRIAKDCGSAAVLLATLLAGAVWLVTLYTVFAD
ncbi:diacylglycerol kinase [Pararhizobium mangrovi]|uniref:diacylglycerol kinase n=1 Tax=Pararhizobium mangrovi TaxID=2590452 RepID=UPI0038B2EF3F